jgi:hypothetical protein
MSYLQLIFLAVVYFVCKHYYAKYKVEHGKRDLAGNILTIKNEI